MANNNSPFTAATSWPPVLNPNQIANAKIGANSYLPNLIAFGTDGIVYGIIVKDIRSTPMISEVTCEQGSGFTAAQVIINDGDLVEMTCVDDRNPQTNATSTTQWPLTGTPITILNPQPNGQYISSGEVFMTINNNYSVVQKQFGERTLICKRYTLIQPIQM
jgi:hypothetical protein